MAGERELLEEPLQAGLVLADVGVNLAVRPFEVSIGHQCRPPVPRAGDVEHVQVVLLDDPVQVNVEEVLARRGSPMAEQARLDVLELQRLLEEWVVHQVDLADGQVVRGPPVGVYLAQLLRGERTCCRGLAAISGLSFYVGACGCHGSFLVWRMRDEAAVNWPASV
jgi:hypothetical protein